MKRHELLKKNLVESFEWTIEAYDRRWDDLISRLQKPDTPQTEFRSEQISWAVSQAVLRHLELGPIENLLVKIERGIEQAVEFFYGDWWKLQTDDQYFLDKSAEYPVQGWYQSLCEGVLLSDWGERWETGQKLLDWVDADVSRGVQHGDPYLNYTLLLVSTLHRNLPNHDELCQLVEKKGNAFERLLADCCQSIAENNHARFAKNVSKAVKKFQRSIAEDVPNPVFWVSLDLSLLWSFARHAGMQLPELTELEDATIIRQESLGRQSGRLHT